VHGGARPGQIGGALNRAEGRGGGQAVVRIAAVHRIHPQIIHARHLKCDIVEADRAGGRAAGIHVDLAELDHVAGGIVMHDLAVVVAHERVVDPHGDPGIDPVTERDFLPAVSQRERAGLPVVKVAACFGIGEIALVALAGWLAQIEADQRRPPIAGGTTHLTGAQRRARRPVIGRRLRQRDAVGVEPKGEIALDGVGDAAPVDVGVILARGNRQAGRAVAPAAGQQAQARWFHGAPCGEAAALEIVGDDVPDWGDDGVGISNGLAGYCCAVHL